MLDDAERDEHIKVVLGRFTAAIMQGRLRVKQIDIEVGETKLLDETGAPRVVPSGDQLWTFQVRDANV